jgi:hypothetical protein
MPDSQEAAPFFASTTLTEGMTEQEFEAFGEAEPDEQEPMEGDPEGHSVLERLEDPDENDPGFDVAVMASCTPVISHLIRENLLQYKLIHVHCAKKKYPSTGIPFCKF